MKYAVIYLSQTGNTKDIAEELFLSLPADRRTIASLSQLQDIPQADHYFIGFPVHHNTCPLEVIDLLEQIESSNITFFATCGLTPTENYRKYIEKSVLPWINNDCLYCGTFLCQGSAAEVFTDKMLASAPESVSELEKVFQEGKAHPNDDDYDAIIKFAEKIIGVS